MHRDLTTLTDTSFDLLVIGGGMFGACAACDAAQRGLSVAIIERGDFAGATSANSFKMVHGGIRYLQHGDVYRIRQSANERRVLLKIAPHLVRPLPIVIPTYGHGIKGKAALRLGMGMYDLLTLDANRGIVDPARRIPWGRCISRHEVLAMFPGLERHRLTGAAIFCDGQIYNPPRLVLSFVQSAVEAGAVAANYVEAVGLLRDPGNPDRVVGVRARDVLGQNDLEIRAGVVLNAAGPYAERLLQRAADTTLTLKGTYSRDACFVVSRQLLDAEYAVALLGRTHDPDAVLSRGARHLFVVPWRNYTLLGVWHKVYRDDPDRFTVTDDELQRFIDEVNDAYPALGLSLDDVALWNAGLVPFGDNPDDAADLRYGHRSHLIDHAVAGSQVAGGVVENLITLIGVRLTTGRCEAVRAVDLAWRKLGHKPPRTRSAVTAVFGGRIDDFERYVQEAIAHRPQPQRIDEHVMRSLVHNYGSEYSRLLRYVEQEATMAETIGASTTIKAQVRLAVRQEMAQTLADVVFRRTDLATGEYPGRDALRTCAELMAADLYWNAGQIERQIERVAARFPRRVVAKRDYRPIAAAS